MITFSIFQNHLLVNYYFLYSPIQIMIENLEIKFEDNDILIINKPIGFDSEKDVLLIKKHKKINFLEVTHRLDKRVTGLLLFAKNTKALANLNEQFATKKVVKKYKAIVGNKPPKQIDSIEHWLEKNIKSQKAKVVEANSKNAKRAVLKYEVKQFSEKYFLLDIELTTGRFHQIRVQLAAIKCPIVGDIKYGYKRTTNDGSIFLQSYFIQFVHPTKNELLQFELPIPEVWRKYGFE